MRLSARLTAAALSAALLLPTAAAAQTPGDARREDLTFLLSTLEEAHPDLYANSPQAVFQAKDRKSVV